MRMRKYVLTAVIDGEEVSETYISLERAEHAARVVLTMNGSAEVEIRIKRIWMEG